MRAEYLPAIAEAMEADVNALDEAERKKTICKSKEKMEAKGLEPLASPLVRRALIPAELCFHQTYFSIILLF